MEGSPAKQPIYSKEDRKVTIFVPHGNLECPFENCGRIVKGADLTTARKRFKNHCISAHKCAKKNIVTQCGKCLEVFSGKQMLTHSCLLDPCRHCGIMLTSQSALTRHQKTCSKKIKSQTDAAEEPKPSEQPKPVPAEKAVEWSMECNPDNTFVRGRILVLNLPISHNLICPVVRCSFKTNARSSKAVRDSIKQHWDRVHIRRWKKAEFTGRVNRCSLCEQDIQEADVTQHKCFEDKVLKDEIYKCDGCKVCFQRKTALIMHLKNCADYVMWLESRSSVMATLDGQQVASQAADASKKGIDTGKNPVSLASADILEPEESDPAVQLYSPYDEGPTIDSQKPDFAEIVSLGTRLKAHMSTLRKIRSSSEGANVSWAKFCIEVARIQETIRKHCKVPDSQETSSISRRPNINNCSIIQKMYNRNPRRTWRNMSSKKFVNLEMSQEKIIEQMTDSLKAVECDKIDFPCTSRLKKYNVSKRSTVQVSCFSNRDIKERLFKFSNTAPGPDRITYNHWKNIDPNCDLLKLIFDICLFRKKIPPEWKKSRTVYIPKRDNVSQDILTDWQPIALFNTVFKLYCSVLNDRMFQWLDRYQVLSPCQKGGLWYDGVFETLYYLDYRARLAHTARSELIFIYLDISRAFPSICHNTVLDAIKHYGCGEELVDIVRDILTGCSTRVQTKDGFTEAIPINRGLCLGLPLSATLFNLVVNHMFESLNPDPSTSRHLIGYVDDMVVIAESVVEANNLVNQVSYMLRQMKLEINVSKTKCKYRKGNEILPLPSPIKIDSEIITSLSHEDSHKFLGKDVKFAKKHDQDQLDEILKSAQLVQNSKLAFWQKLDCLKRFVFSKVPFLMRNSFVLKGQWDQLDKDLATVIRLCAGTKKTSAVYFMYTSSNKGGLGMPLLVDLYDVYKVDNSFKLLTSKDDFIRRISRIDLTRAFVTPNQLDSEKWNIVNDVLSNKKDNESNVAASLWGRTRLASQKLNVKWEVNGEDASITLNNNDERLTSANRNRVVTTLRLQLQDKYIQKFFVSAPFQSRVFYSVSKDQESSFFLRNANNYSFQEWLFVLNARLGLVHLRTLHHSSRNNKKSKNEGNGKNEVQRAQNYSYCRRCNNGTTDPFQESIAHVLGVCQYNTNLIINRHNAILKILIEAAQAAKFEVISYDEFIIDLNKKPDLVISKDKAVHVIDVTVPYEKEFKCLIDADNEKVKKYEDVCDYYIQQGYSSAQSYGFVVGALGSFYPNNEKVLNLFFTTKWAKVNCKRACVNQAIKGSNAIYRRHISSSVEAFGMSS